VVISISTWIRSRRERVSVRERFPTVPAIRLGTEAYTTRHAIPNRTSTMRIASAILPVVMLESIG
jgi:hypothetical protein